MKTHPLTAWRCQIAILLCGLSLLPATAADQVTPIIERGDEWRYLDTGVTPPAIGGVASWKAANYNAAAAGSPWKTGRGIFGYGDNIDYGATLTAGAGNPATLKYLTHYFWKSFQIPSTAVFGAGATATYNGFLLRIVRDDAVAVYVNGTEIFLQGPSRDNLPPSGTIGNTTAALSPLEGQSETSTIDFVELRDLLKPFPATNTIAVELHQASNTTTDARFDMAFDLITSEPCYGDSRVGAFAIFSAVGRGVFNGTIHERDALEEPSPPDYTFDEQDTEMNWRTTSGSDTLGFFGPTVTEYVTSADLPSSALAFYAPLPASPLNWESEVIDLRGFKDVVASARVLGVKRNNVTWGTSDRLEFTVRVSGDGLTFRDIPWQRITSTTSVNNATAWTDLVAESATKKAVVQTAANNPLNTGAGNWRTAAFNDSAWPTGTKGAGYENNPGDATNYTDLIDPALDFKSELFGATPKKSVVLMRCVFPAFDRATFTALRLLMKYDDGFVVHLNDQEIARKNVAVGAVPTIPTAALPTPTSLASQGNTDTNAVIYEEFNLTPHLTKVSTTDQNVLAVYALNDKVDSSDMVVWPVLQIGKPGGPPPLSLTTITPPISTPQPAFTVENFTAIDTSVSGANGTNLIPAGTQSIRIKIVGNIVGSLQDKGFYIDDIKLSGTPTAADSFDSFMAMAAPTSSVEARAATADLDGDSIKNMHEYAYGTNPTVAAVQTDINGVPTSIEPEVYLDATSRWVIRFRLAGGDVTGDPGNGYEIHDLNVRPQISFGSFGVDDWKDAVNAIPYFEQVGPFVENNDGSVTVTCRTIEIYKPETTSSLYLRLRVGVRFPSYLNGIATPCYQP